MSAIVKEAMRNAAGLRPNERLVLVAVAAHADRDGRNAFPSVDTIAELAGVARRTVQRALARLVELGRLVVDRSRGRRTNVYALPRQSGAATVSPGTATAPSEAPTVPPMATPEVEDQSKMKNRAAARDWRRFLPKTKTPNPQRQPYPYPERRGAALPVDPRAGQCPSHRGSPAGNCGPCRSERIGGAA